MKPRQQPGTRRRATPLRADDGQAPLDTPGLRLHERVTQIAESLQRVEQKGGSHPSLSG